MTLGSILLGIALLALVGLYVARPLLAPSARTRLISNGYDYDELTELKEAYLTEIFNLDFDYEMQKIPEEAYRRQRAMLVAEASEVLQQLDEVEDTGRPEVPYMVEDRPYGTAGAGVDAEIEAAVARLRNARQEAPATNQGLVGEQSRVSGTENGRTKYCPQCGQKTKPDDRFCVACGHKLDVPQHA